MNILKIISGFFFIFFSSSCVYAQVDLLIFSYDRPLQLYALLESIDLNVKGERVETVIYRASSERVESGYQLVQKDFPHVIFKSQDHHNARADFKPLVIQSLFNASSSARYVLFAVDDNVITGPINLERAAEEMEAHHAYGFFFRLGLNIDHCYMTNTPSGVPSGNQISSDLFTWKIGEGKGDWNYPNNVDFTLYRKEDIRPFFLYHHYTFPNDLEAYWAGLARNDVRGLCYIKSRLINIPMNVVSTFKNRQMHYKNPQECVNLFLEGYKIDIHSLQGIENNSPHFEVEPKFILRP